jgi:hypothetical protein
MFAPIDPKCPAMETAMKKSVFICALLLLFAGSPQQARQTTQPSGSIEGSVIKFGTTDAIPRAKVTLRPANSANSRAVTADDGGKFTFRDLAPGQYRLTVTRDGYVAGEYGQRSPTGVGVPIVLAAQQQFKDARIALTPAGTITGRLLNRYGEPAANVNVQALRYTYQDGRRTLTPVQTIATNDLGEYRLFFMPPGQYIISAQPANPMAVEPGGTVFVQAARGSGPAALGGLGAQLGVGGVTRITVMGANSAGEAFGGPVGPGMPAPPPPPPPIPPGFVSDDSNLFLPVYYPGTTDVTSASPVDLRAGGIVGGINLALAEARPVRIRGQVLNGGRPAAGAQVSIFLHNNPGGSLTVRSAAVNNETGAFEFRNMAPGGYEIVASMNAPGPGAMIMATPLGNAAGITPANVGRGRPSAPVLGARAQVDVLTSDIDGVSLQLETGFDISGRVAFEGQSANNTQTLPGLRIQLQSEPRTPVLAVPGVASEADGTFVLSGVTPGTYRLSVAGLPRNVYIKAARIGGVDILNGGIRIDSEPRGGLEIALGNAPASLDVVVRDDRQLPVAAVTVALVPEGAQRRYDVYRSATTDAQGRIHLDGVVPGEYKVYAWESVENGAWTDPDFIRNYQNSGVAVRASEGSSATAEVRVIPYRAD